MGVMGIEGVFVVVLVSLLASTMSEKMDPDKVPSDFNRTYFPNGTLFGTTEAAYQYEGYANKSGRGPSIWDFFTHEFPERVDDGSNGNDAINFYELYKSDIKALQEMNTDVIRISISWSRLIPFGKIAYGVNEDGIKFYNDTINEIVDNGMVPIATLYHFDVPLSLQMEYGGFLSREIVEDFVDYADLCFKLYGDRVKLWNTINEPYTYAYLGFDSGSHAPGRCSEWVNRACKAGDSATEPYIVGHNSIFAHAAAVHLYREKYQKEQQGKIGITLSATWYEPYDDTEESKEAAKRGMDFKFGWFLDPLTYGHYPRSMQQLVGDRLPKFNDAESSYVKGTCDFLGLNYYKAYYAQNVAYVDPYHQRMTTDPHIKASVKNKDGKQIGPAAIAPIWYVYPYGIRYLMNYTKDNYRDPEIYITENGVPTTNVNITLEEAVNDTMRIEFHKEHLWNLLISIKEYNVKVKGYMVWSYLDNFEWAFGYTVGFGLAYVNRTTMERTHKKSALWYHNFLSPPVFLESSPSAAAAATRDIHVNTNNNNNIALPRSLRWGYYA